MVGWVILAAYVIGWAGFSVTIARFMQADKYEKAEDAFEAATLVAMAMMIAIFWPLVIPGGWVYKRVFAPKEKDD